MPDPSQAVPGSTAAGSDPPPPAFCHLLERWRVIHHLQAAGSLLRWDQEVSMPPAGAAARAEQNATVGRLAHEALVDPQVGEWLEALRDWEGTLPPDSWEAAVLRVARRQCQRARRIPVALVADRSALPPRATTLGWRLAANAGLRPFATPCSG